MKNIRIINKGLLINTTLIYWSDIIGIKEHTSEIVKQMSTRGTFVEIIVNTGKAYVIHSKDNITFEDNNMDHAQLTGYEKLFNLINIIKNNAKNINDFVSGWFEWRLILPMSIVQIGVMIFGLLSKYNFEAIVTNGLIAAIITFPFSWAWERKARKKLWNLK